MVNPKDDEEVAMLTLPENRACPEVINWVMLVVAKVEVPLAVKSNTPEMSPPRITPLANVVVANLPLMVMLSFESLPRTTSPLRVVVAVTVKSSETSKLFVIETSPNNVVVPLTHKPPDKIEFPETRSWVMLVVACVLVAAMFNVEPK